MDAPSLRVTVRPGVNSATTRMKSVGRGGVNFPGRQAQPSRVYRQPVASGALLWSGFTLTLSVFNTTARGRVTQRGWSDPACHQRPIDFLA
jgi:hypothetical protein